MTSKFVVAIASSAVLGFCLVGAVSGNDEKTVEVRTIGIPPYGVESSTNPGGIYYDLANLLAEEAGYQANNYFYPYARIVNELKSGETDMTIMFKYKELEGHVVYVAPLPALKIVVVGVEGTRFGAVEDLRGKTLAYLRGAKFGELIDDDPQIRKQVTNDFIQGAEMLAFGRVDAIIGPIEPIVSAVENLDSREIVLGEPFVVSERTPWIQVSRKSADRLPAETLNQIFLEIVARGDLETIRAKYVRP